MREYAYRNTTQTFYIAYLGSISAADDVAKDSQNWIGGEQNAPLSIL